MPEHSVEVRKMIWTEAVPPMRLLSTFRRAFALGPIAAALALVTIAVILGGGMDAAWRYFGCGVIVAPAPTQGAEELRSEIDAFAALDSAGYQEYRRSMDARRGQAPVEIDNSKRVAEAHRLIDARLARALAVVAADQQLSRTQRAESRTRLRQSADVVRFQLAGSRINPYPALDPAIAIEQLLARDPDATVAQRTADGDSLRDAIRRVQAVEQWRSAQPKGPFAALVDYETRCAAAAIRGAVTGRWGLQASARSLEPALLGSLVSAAQGLLWLLVERPWYALLYFVLLIVLVAPFAGMICRLTAIEIAREEQGENRKAFAFMRERRWSMVGAPLFCIAIAAGIGLLVAAGSIVGGIPYIGPILTALFFFLALLGGLAIALFALMLVLGFPLMWPTIAVEGSDSFDAVQRGGTYPFVRPGLAGFCFLIVLLNWTVAVLVARVVAMVALKFTHCTVNAGMSLFRSSAQTDTIGSLDAIWWMPAWQDLALLPSTGDVPFWGVVAYGPLGGGEKIAAFLIGLWIALVVGVVVSFAISFIFAGLTEIYFVLRRAIDGTDYSEIYFERVPDEFSADLPAGDVPAAASAGKALPVVTPRGS